MVKKELTKRVFLAGCVALLILGCHSSPEEPQSRDEREPVFVFPRAVPVGDASTLPMTEPRRNAVPGDVIAVTGGISSPQDNGPRSEVRFEVWQERQSAKPIIMARELIPFDDSGNYRGEVTLPRKAGTFGVYVLTKNDLFVGRSHIIIKQSSKQ